MYKVLLAAAIVIVPAAAHAQEDDDEWLHNCRSMRWSGRKPTVCEVQVKSLEPRSMLMIRPGRNGAVTIIGSSNPRVEVHTRLQASADSRADAEDLMRRVRTDLGETITATGPEPGYGAHWAVSFVIYVPRNTNFAATTHNGPIAVKNVVGRMELSAQNGPISLSGVGGDVHARAQNGPLDVKLTGMQWVGEGLDAETRNGPVTVEIPSDYNAALETGTVNGPMDSEFPITVTLQGRHWKRITTKLGNGGPPVRVVTTNGPASLRRP